MAAWGCSGRVVEPKGIVMAEEESSKQDQEAIDQWARAVLAQFASGRTAEDIVRDLNASGWPRDGAEQFVAQMESQWREIEASPSARASLYLQLRFPDMRPIKSLPSLTTINGIGAGLYGARDNDPETGTYVKTHCMCILFVPVIALAAYRVAALPEGGWSVMGRVPLSKLAKAWNWMLLCTVLALIAWGVVSAYTGSADYQAGRKLAQADQAAAEGNLVEASRLYAEVARSRTEHGATARERLVALIESADVDALELDDLIEVFQQAASAPRLGEAQSRIFGRGVALVKARAPAAPRQSARLLGAIRRLSSEQAFRTLTELLAGPWSALRADDAVAVFRAAVEIPESDEQKRSLAAVGAGHSKRLAASDPLAAVELLEALVPLGAPSAIAEALKTVLGTPLDAASCPVVAKVIKSAKGLAGRDNEKAVIARGFDWLDNHPQADARQALVLADLLAESSAADAERVAATRRRLLERIVKTDPKDVEAAVQLALLLERAGDAKGIEALLTPHRDKLADGEGARLLGQLLAAQGKFDESYALLSPYLEKRLGAFHDAEKAFEAAIVQGQQRIVRQLQQGSATGFDFDKFRFAADNDKETMVHQYVNEHLKDDSAVAEARDKLARQAGVVPAALDLGMVILHRARAMDNAEARRAELERAEKTFLAVRGAAGDNEKFLLQLGQVYYWLGKHDEGHQQFEKLLSTHERKFEMLVGVANVLRELGAMDEARKLFEEAYEKTGDARQRSTVAHMRAITNTDRKDKIAWLDRCDKGDSGTKALLAEARGEQAAEEGDDPQAAVHFREAVAIYEAETKTPTVYNNGGLAYLALFAVTGERDALDHGIEWLEKAVALTPADALVVSNVAHALLRAAAQDLASPELNLRELHASGFSSLAYLAPNQDALTKIRRRVREHAGVKKGLVYLNQALVISPKNHGAYAAAREIHTFVRDVEPLRRLARQVAAADLETHRGTEKYLQYVRYQEEDSAKKEMAVAISRAEALVERYGKQKKGPAFAVVVAQLFTLRQAAADPAAVDVDRIIDLARQAHDSAPSRGTWWTMIESLLLRAERSLVASQPEFAQAVQGTRRSVPANYAVVLALGRNGALGDAARNNKDVQQAAALVLQWLDAFPEDVSYWAWAMLRAAHPSRASAVAQSLSKDEVDQLDRQIGALLSPASTASVCGEYWQRLATGNRATAQEPFQRLAKLGIPFPQKLLE
jgi:tetratricopeptide (TPR) repeat protein